MARIASLYIPWLGIVIENIGRLDYRKRIVNKILKRPINLSSQRYLSKIIFVYFYLLKFYTFHTLDEVITQRILLRECH